MTISRINFADVNAADIQSLIDTGTPEGPTIEYKAQTYGSRDEDVKEFLKDLSSFANSGGGHLLIGVEETGGVASAIRPLTTDIDKEISRPDNMARDGIEPRLQAQFRPVQVAGGSIIAIRVSPSWAPPHRVTARKTNRIYVRGSAGAYEASMDEMRNLFTSSNSAKSAAVKFRELSLLRIDNGATPIPLATEQSRLVMQIAPLSAFGASPHMADLATAQAMDHKLRPVRSSGFSSAINFDGFLVYRGGQDCHGYTQLHRDGRLEAVKVGALGTGSSRRMIPSAVIETSVMDAFPGYMEALVGLGFVPPFFVAITLQNVEGAVLATRDQMYDEPLPCQYKHLELPFAIVESVGSAEELQGTLRPAFDALWNSAGWVACANFNADGLWIRR